MGETTDFFKPNLDISIALQPLIYSASLIELLHSQNFWALEHIKCDGIQKEIL